MTKKKEKQVLIGVSVSETVAKQIEAIADRDCCSKSSVLRKAFKLFMEQQAGDCKPINSGGIK